MPRLRNAGRFSMQDQHVVITRAFPYHTTRAYASVTAHFCLLTTSHGRTR
jgi:hypothetical protein